MCCNRELNPRSIERIRETQLTNAMMTFALHGDVPVRDYADDKLIVRWLGIQWIGVPMPLRWWLWLRWENLPKMPGCGCIRWLKEKTQGRTRQAPGPRKATRARTQSLLPRVGQDFRSAG